jgi:hypothetical protein
MTIAIALTWTISTAFWTGFACYAVAAAGFWKASAPRVVRGLPAEQTVEQ